MVLLEKLWDDVVAGPQPECGLGMLRRITTQPLNTNEGGAVGAKDQGSVSTPTTPVTPITPGSSGRKDNVWRSVFHPGSNLNTRGIGAAVFDKPTQPNSPTVYDWLYSGESRSQHR